MDDNAVPNLTEQEAWEYLHDDLGIPLGRRAIKHAVINREITPTRLSGRNLFSRNDIHEWLESRRQPEPGRPVRDHKAVAAK